MKITLNDGRTLRLEFAYAWNHHGHSPRYAGRKPGVNHSLRSTRCTIYLCEKEGWPHQLASASVFQHVEDPDNPGIARREALRKAMKDVEKSIRGQVWDAYLGTSKVPNEPKSAYVGLSLATFIVVVAAITAAGIDWLLHP